MDRKQPLLLSKSFDPTGLGGPGVPKEHMTVTC